MHCPDVATRCTVAHNLADALQLAHDNEPEYAVVDLRIGTESGLELVRQLSALDENTRIVMLTGYASVATAVESIKLGAVHYLTKPATADEVVAALHRDEGDSQRRTGRSRRCPSGAWNGNTCKRF